MAARCHGERGMMGGDRSLRGQLVSELRLGQPWRQVQSLAVICPRPLLRDSPNRSSEADFILTLAQNLRHAMFS